MIIGGLAGWLAEKFMKSEMGLFMNIVLGIAFLNARTIQIRRQAPTKPAIRYPIHPARLMPTTLRMALATAAPND